MNPPRFTVPAKWGLCFAGNESAFCSALDVALATADTTFQYVEIGIGHGDGLRAVSQYLAQQEKPFHLTGVDIASCDRNALNPASYPHKEHISIKLNGAANFFRNCASWQADFIFIDGCHGAPCVESDFLGAEKVMRSGGVVAFHDTDPGCQDIHMQPHCQTGIRAREAVEKLGLLNDTRKGWFKIGETTGDKELGGHGCLFVKKV